MSEEFLFEKGISNIYKKVGYFDKYGGSFVVSFMTILSFILVFSYFWVNSQIKPIKADWQKMKCHPGVLPFAGMVNAPPGTSKFKFTADNFSSCMYSILSDIVGRFTRPAFFLSDAITQLFKVMLDMVNAIRGVLNYIRSKIMAIIMQILERFINVITPVQVVIIKMKSLMGKVTGSMVSALYTAIGSYYALKSFIGAFLRLIIMALIALAGVVIILWIFPWTWALAYVGTAAYVAIAIPTVIIAVWMDNILNSGINDPPDCCCFDENTELELLTGTKKIKDIKLGDILRDGAEVLTKLKILNRNKKMYDIDGVLVSGSHYIYCNKKGWVKVEEYTNNSVITTNEFIYCIGTSNKRIVIGNNIFMDWDDITDEDIVLLKNRKTLDSNDGFGDIHTKLNGGFVSGTKIELGSGNPINIENINAGDILKNGTIVLATVEIESSKLDTNVYDYNGVIFSGKNLMMKDNLGINHSRDRLVCKIKVNKLYHLVTDKGEFYTNGLTFLDYNGCIEQVLDIYMN